MRKDPSHLLALAGGAHGLTALPSRALRIGGACLPAMQAQLRLSVRVGALLALAVVAEMWLMRLTHLPQASYSRRILAAEVVAPLVSGKPFFLVTLLGLLVATAAAARARSLGAGWQDFEHGGRLRALIVLVAAVLAWAYATYGYNFFLGQGHDLDRFLLLALVPLLAWRPVFVFAFLLVLLPILWQFGYPIGGFSWAAPMLLIRVLVLFGALWVVRTSMGRARTADFVFLLCCLIAAHYWVSGFGKLQLGWLARDRIGYLLPATYANGWLAFLEPDRIAELTRALLWLNGPAKLATLLIECGALFALWRRRTLRLFLVAWIGLHGAIFLATGIFFWKWMLLAAVVLLLFFGRRGPQLPIFTRAHFLLSLVLIGGGALWFRPQKLAWLDARVSYTYRIEAVGQSGRSYSLPPRFFAPYDYQFTLGNFRYLVAAPHLPITWGATYRRELADALQHSTTAEQVLALEAELGQNAFDPERSAGFDRFVQQFVGNWNRRQGAREWWGLVQAPPLLWTFSRGPLPSAADPLVRIVVYQVTSLFDDEHYREIRVRPVREIPLPAPEPRPPPRSGTG
jgi:hypothetical protein